jgi:NDP-sugar pyrophosphorylase family protein
MKAVILAGGKGTRLAPYTKVIPKPLMPIGDMPILSVLLTQMQHAGITDVVLTVGHMASLLEAFFADGCKYDLNITYSHEDCPLGTAGPLALVEGLDESFLVANGDVLTTLPLAELIACHKENRAAATIAMHQRQVRINLGVIDCDGGDLVIGYREKPTIDYHASMGIYVFDPVALNYIPRGEYLDFPDLVHKLLAAGEKVMAFPFDGYWRDLGCPDDYEQAVLDFETMRDQFLLKECNEDGVADTALRH